MHQNSSAKVHPPATSPRRQSAVASPRTNRASLLLNEEAACADICRIAGARYVGIQQCWGLREDLCLFQEHERASTLALPLSAMEPSAVAAKIQAARKIA